MLQSAHHHDALRTRMLRVLDQNLEGLFLGRYVAVSKGTMSEMSCRCFASVHKRRWSRKLAAARCSSVSRPAM